MIKGHGIKKLVIYQLKRNKVRNLLIMVTIACSMMLFEIVLILTNLSKEVIKQDEMRTVGTTAQGFLSDRTKEDYDRLVMSKVLKNVTYSIYINYLDNPEFAKRKVQLRYYDELAAKMSFMELEEGRMPESSNEIVVDSYVFDALGLQSRINQSIKLQFDFCDQSYTETFRIIGYYVSNDRAKESTVLISKSYIDKLMNSVKSIDANERKEKFYGSGLYTILFDLNNSKSVTPNNIKNIVMEAGVCTDVTDNIVNTAYLQQKIDPITVIGLMFIILIIISTGFFSIYNIFLVSVYNDVQLYAILNSIGATESHLRKLIMIQLSFLGIVGIPIGLILGQMIGLRLLPKYLVLFTGNYVTNLNGIQPSVGISLISILLTIVMILYSGTKPARIAADFSPIEAISYQGTRKKRKQRIINLHLKSIYKLAYYNVFGDKRKFCVILFSLSLSCILFTAIFSLAKSFDYNKCIRKYVLSDLQIASKNYLYGNNEKTDDVIKYSIAQFDTKEIMKLPGVASQSELYYKSVMDTPCDKLIENLKLARKKNKIKSDENQSIVQHLLNGEKCLNEKRYFVGESILSKLNVIDGSIDSEKFLSGNYVILVNTGVGRYCHIGDTISLSYPDRSSEYTEYEGYRFYKDSLTKNYTVLAIVEIPYQMEPYGVSNGLLKTISPLCELETTGFQAELSAYVYDIQEKYQVDTEKKVSDYIQKYYTDCDYVSKKNVVHSFSQLIYMICLIGGSLTAIIGMIGILNLISYRASSIFMRKHEFATLSSIGMSDMKLIKMIMIEVTIQVGLISIITLIFGGIVSYSMVNFISKTADYFTYHFHLLPSLVALAFIYIIDLMVAIIGIKKNKGSIIKDLTD